MKCFFYIFILLIFSLTHLNASENDVNAQSRPHLAVSKFTPINVELYIADKVRESITNYIIQANKYKVVERAELERIMQEINLSQSDLYDPNSAIKLGRLISARGIIVGMVTENAGNILIQARLVDLQTGQVIRSSKAETPYEENISRACAKVAYELINLPYNDDVVKDEVFLDYPFWNQYLLGLNVGVGLTRRLGRFEGYNDIDVISNDMKFVFQVSFRSMLFFSKSSNFGILIDAGIFTYRIHEAGTTVSSTAPYNMVIYYDRLTLTYFYYSLAPLIRFRDFHFYIGPYIGHFIGITGKINPYQEAGSPPSVIDLGGQKKYFKSPDIGLTGCLGVTFKNLPNKMKLIFSIDFRFQLRTVYDEDQLKAMGLTKIDLLKDVRMFSLYLNIGLMFGIK